MSLEHLEKVAAFETDKIFPESSVSAIPEINGKTAAITGGLILIVTNTQLMAGCSVSHRNVPNHYCSRK